MKKMTAWCMGLALVGSALVQAAGCIGKSTAEQDALAAVGGGTVLKVVFEAGDKPPHWSVDVKKTKGGEAEVWVSCSGKILRIIPGG
jgi:hypothetical protein